MKLNIRHILVGWGKKWGVIPTSEAEKKLSELRLVQCDHCIHAKESNILKLLDGEASTVKVLYCTLCTCPCEAKSLVPKEYCPVGKW